MTKDDILRMTREDLIKKASKDKFDNTNIQCSRIYMCFFCSHCLECTGCSYCVDCDNCTHCDYCSHCKDCNFCFKCHDLVAKDFYIFNVKLKPHEYDAVMAKIKG